MSEEEMPMQPPRKSHIITSDPFAHIGCTVAQINGYLYCRTHGSTLIGQLPSLGKATKKDLETFNGG